MYSSGANKSPKDIRDFAYVPSKAKWQGGKRYDAKDIEDQQKVGICTAISMTQHARKVQGIKFSADFQYLIQKKLVDGNWNEGSSVSSAVYVAYKYGLLPEIHWKYKISRNQPYHKYIEELKAIPEKEITKLLKIASQFKIKGYARVPVQRDLLANAIDEAEGGLLTRMECGATWWTKPIEPIRYPKPIMSGHAIINTNYTGNSFRVANTWGAKWADKGTAYFMLNDNPPTEAWIVYYNKLTKGIVAQKKKQKTFIGKVKKFIQKKIISKLGNR